MKLRPALCWLLATAALLAISSPAAEAQGRRQIRQKEVTYEEPKPDMSLPVVHADSEEPEFGGEGVLTVDRTGIYGGTFIYSFIAENETFNPVEPKGATSQELRALAFSRLVAYNSGKWATEPDLAESWITSEDKKTWTFRLREGVFFSDGQPVTIEDVKFSFDAVFHPDHYNSIKDGFKDRDGNLPTYEIVDDRHIRFTTAYVDSQFLVHVGNVCIIPAHKWSQHLADGTFMEQMKNSMDPKDLVGTGPFMLKQYLSAEQIEYVRNPYFWRKDARGKRLPYLDRVIVKIVPDRNTEWLQFESGELHCINDFDVSHYQEAVALEKKSGGQQKLVGLGVSLNTNWFCLNLNPRSNPETGKPYVDPKKQRWFHNRDFRVAVNHALNREGMVKAAMGGRGKPIWSTFTEGNKQWYHPGVQKYEHSIQKAREILDELGWKDTDGDGIREDDRGHRISFTLNTNVENPLRQQMGNLIQADLRAIGLDVTFQPIAFNKLVSNLQDDYGWEGMLLGWGAGVPPDPANGKNITMSNGRLHVWNPRQEKPATEWEARVDELMSKMDEELDDKVRKKYNDEILELIARECPIFYLCASNAYSSVRAELGNIWPSLLRPRITHNIEELYLKENGQP